MLALMLPTHVSTESVSVLEGLIAFRTNNPSFQFRIQRLWLNKELHITPYINSQKPPLPPNPAQNCGLLTNILTPLQLTHRILEFLYLIHFFCLVKFKN
jgi:hypothetical protein